MARLLLSAAHKSSGKTTITVGLAAALRTSGQTVQAFKKGPDYIDPMWLSRASGRTCYNLDFNTQSQAEICATFSKYSTVDSIGLIEGNKGLYDGVDVEGTDSSAALASLLDAPVVLVIDTVGITRGVAPLIMGYVSFDRSVNIKGVILNRVASCRHETKLRQALELYTDMPVLGAVGRDKSLVVNERHLGLTTPDEILAVDGKIGFLERAVKEGVNLDQIVEAARSAPALAPPYIEERCAIKKDIVIGVARDSAFNFYYPDDLEALERAGARLEFFSPISDKKLPTVDGLLIGGGFPETHMQALEANGEMRACMRNAAESGLPIYAECGGLMYLARSISWQGKQCNMVGAIPGRIKMKKKPQGRGLVVLEETEATPWMPDAANRAGGRHLSIPAHEFHYARLVDLKTPNPFAWRVKRGHGIDGAHDGVVFNNVLAGFCHQRDTERNRWVERFVSFIRRRKKQTSRS